MNYIKLHFYNIYYIIIDFILSKLKRLRIFLEIDLLKIYKEIMFIQKDYQLYLNQKEVFKKELVKYFRYIWDIPCRTNSTLKTLPLYLLELITHYVITCLILIPGVITTNLLLLWYYLLRALLIPFKFLIIYLHYI